MKGRKGLSIVTTFILLAMMALPHKNSYGTPVFDEIPSFSQCNEHGPQPILTAQNEIEYWTCPMHPDVKMKEPGKCPVCGMDLTPVMKKPDSETQSAPNDGAEESEQSPDKGTSEGSETHDHSAYGKETSAPQNE